MFRPVVIASLICWTTSAHAPAQPTAPATVPPTVPSTAPAPVPAPATTQATAAPTSAPTTGAAANDLSTPKGAVRSLATAMQTGDKPALLAVLHTTTPVEARLAKVMADLAES